MILFKIVYFSLLYVFPISIPNILVSISSDVKRFDMIPSILSVINTVDNLITSSNETSITSWQIPDIDYCYDDQTVEGVNSGAIGKSISNRAS